MADTNRTVGVGGDDVNITAWETVVDGLGGDHTATLISDIVDNVYFSSWAAGTVTIKGNLTGNTKRKITSAALGTDVLTPASSSLSSFTLEDLHVDGSPMTAFRQTISLQHGLASCTIRRCTIEASPSMVHYCLEAHANADYTTGTYENCIFIGATHQIVFTAIDYANASTFRNCIFTGAGSNQGYHANNSNVTVLYFNCVSFNNANSDFNPGGANTITNTTNCVSEGSTAATGHDATSGSVEGKTLLSTYFRDEAGDFRLLQDDYDSWGINGDSTNTPALDYASVTRTNDDIGPYEFRRGAAAGVGSGVGFSAAKKHTFW